jgi:hypothetical protein
VLRRPIGGIDVMCAQIEFLIEAAKKPNVRLQIIPFNAGGRAAAGGPFTILRFPEVELPDVVYVEQLTGAIYLESGRTSNGMRWLWTRCPSTPNRPTTRRKSSANSCTKSSVSTEPLA